MKKLALGALFVGLTACGGGSDSTKVHLTDSGTGDTGSDVCNPLMQTGCLATEKCNWIYDQLTPSVVGHIGCEPVGTTAIGGSCGNRAIGPDSCVKGAECVSGECKAICDNQGGMPMCDADHACVQYQNLFISGSATVAGVCDPACDPLSQDLKVGTAKTACGSADPTKPVKGCYGYDEYSCSGTAPTVGIDVAVTLTDRATPAGDYLNSCAPGYMPLLYIETGSMSGSCNGLCAALEIDSTAAHSGNLKGDATKLGKRPTEAAPAAGHATCGITERGSETSSTCKFLWPYLVDQSTGELTMTDTTDTMGVCFATAHYRYDSNDDGMVNTTDAFQVTVPCNTLPVRTATLTGKHDDAADFGCQKVANSMFVNHPLKKGDKVYVGDAISGMQAELSNVMVDKGGPVPMNRHVFN